MKSEILAWKIRRHAVEITHRTGASHIGSVLSCADILAVLYTQILHFRPEDPQWPDRDRFLLSKGHAALGLYSALTAAAGLLLGWQKMIPAALLASLSGICIHGFRMKRGAGNRLAFGPYLSFGILLTTLAGEDLIQWYLGL